MTPGSTRTSGTPCSLWGRFAAIKCSKGLAGSTGIFPFSAVERIHPDISAFAVLTETNGKLALADR